MSNRYQPARRPVDKESVYVYSSSIGTTQDNTNIRTSTVAETYTGGHLQLSISAVSGGATVLVVLAMIPEGITIPNISSTDGSAIFTPEEYSVWSGAFFIGASQTETLVIKEKLKAMRKMKNGDRLALCIRASGATTANVTAVVTSFFKQ